MLVLLALALTGCQQRLSADMLPTPVTPEALAMAVLLTQNAPPAGFDAVAFPAIDTNLSRLPGWRYTMLIRFEGVFTGTPRPTQASTQSEVWYNQVASSRRVVARAHGELLNQPELVDYEAVRMGPDVFMVRDGVCLGDADGEAGPAADLSAGALLGGVRGATSASRRARINDQEVWLYSFTYDDLVLPALQLGESGHILSASGELWVAPEHAVVVRYYLTMEVESASVFGSTLPLSGTLMLRYDLHEVGTLPNISVPFGC